MYHVKVNVTVWPIFDFKSHRSCKNLYLRGAPEGIVQIFGSYK